MIIVRVKYRNGVFYGLCILYLYLDLKVINLFYGNIWMGDVLSDSFVWIEM